MVILSKSCALSFIVTQPCHSLKNVGQPGGKCRVPPLAEQPSSLVLFGLVGTCIGKAGLNCHYGTRGSRRGSDSLLCYQELAGWSQNPCFRVLNSTRALRFRLHETA